MVKPQLDDLVAEHAHALHFRRNIVLAIHRINAAWRATRGIHGGCPIGGTCARVQRVDLLYRPASVGLVGVVIPSVAEVDARNQNASFAVEVHRRGAIAHRKRAEADAVAILAQFGNGIVVAKDDIAMRGEYKVAKGIVV